MEEEARWDDSSAEASMTVAEPWRCPCGIPPESHHICSAGTCWWCLADRVKAQSDAEPAVSAGLIETKRLTDTAARIINRLQHLIDLTAVQPKRVWRDIIVSEIETMLRYRAADRSAPPDTSAEMRAVAIMAELRRLRSRAADRSGK